MKSSIARCDSDITRTFNEWLRSNKDKYTNSRLILQGATHLISVQMWVDFMDWLYSDSKNFKNTKKGCRNVDTKNSNNSNAICNDNVLML